MATLLPTGGFQLPFQRRLSRLYNDTKKSSDFVQAPVPSEQQDPESKALHRKLRIQKDRLVSWGLEWSDPANQAAEIDESLSRAGLSEVVGSIMSTIKDTLAEAEQLWLSGSRKSGAAPGGGSMDKKVPLVQWDKSRFEDLINDFTASVDTLYDLSRTRGAAMKKSAKNNAYKSSAGEYRPFESTRMQTPQVVDPTQLTEIVAARDLPASVASQRAVVLMSKTAYSEMAQGRTREPWGPLLLEYATFDSVYSVTGIMPPMSRFEKLSAGLQQGSQRSPGAWTGLPRLLGYFEDMENSRFGMVYRFPAPFDTAIIECYKGSAVHEISTLGQILKNPHMEPPLEAKFRLAYNLANTVFDMHARGITHGNLTEDNISFSNEAKTNDAPPNAIVNVRKPLISSFEVFPDEKSDCSCHHPLDPRYSSASPLAKSTDERVLELYALSMILLSIGLWASGAELSLDNGRPAFEAALDRLRVKCGGLYSKAVHACWEAVDLEISGESKGEALLSRVQMRVSRFLETCCILDGVSEFEQRLDAESQEEEPEQLQGEPSTKGVDFKKKPATLAPQTSVIAQTAAVEEGKRHYTKSQCRLQLTYYPAATAKPARKEPKLKLYPQVPLPAEAVEKWNTILMPQINQALRHFYRKHPESVEISLESVGMSPQQTEPTVLVVCSSVGKVRAILNKRVGDLFDGSTGFALKVCRGHVMRSRKQAHDIKRSMANEDEVEAVNPKYQEKPSNGASIGAWIGDRHLPPVSFGGLVVIDNKTYGMTVHHMLDDPDRAFANEEPRRSAAIPGLESYSESHLDSMEDDDEDDGYELSDTESEPYSETDITSEYGDESDEEEDFDQPGDIPGIEPGCGEGYIVTQPALDDVEEGFYPCADTEDEDHLDTYSLGEVYASSGIRRKEANGLVHEVDWALFEFGDGRLPTDNTMPEVRGCEKCSHRNVRNNMVGGGIVPTAVAPSSALPGMEVQCVARTSGLQTGQILPALCSVKIFGRLTPSHTYQVASPPVCSEHGKERQGGHMAMGIPGDSGAWIVSRSGGELCGHVLAWSQRKRVAYICPMDVLLLDIAQTLDAREIRLPDGEAVVVLEEPSKKLADDETECEDEDEEDDDDNVAESDREDTLSSVQLPGDIVSRRGTPLSMQRLAGSMAQLNVGHGQRIDVSS